MNRPTIALACILKDEINHLPGFLDSISGCFDEVWLTDTGSTDGSLEYIAGVQAAALAGCEIIVKNFKWCDDFAAARNFSMEGIKTDYVMWMDLDDRLSSKENFKRWRDNVMLTADFWLAPYNYAFQDPERTIPACVFTRERVIKTAKKFKWRYKIHEGMIADEHVQANMVTNWTVDHHRTTQDYEKDFTRNVSMLEKMSKTEELPPRLKFYYGKELFDKQRFAEAYTWLDQVVDNPSLEHHDRVLTFEYLCRSCLHRFHVEQEYKPQREQDHMLLAKCFALAVQGVTLEPNRAELFCLAADALIKMGRDRDAMPFYSAASKCSKQNTGGFLFVSDPAYDQVPLDQMARLQFKIGDLAGGIQTAKESLLKFKNPETEKLLTEMLNIQAKVVNFERKDQVETDEIVFTCLPGAHPYPFDEAIYKEKGIGGSETALVEVASHLKRMVGPRRVIVFNTRETDWTAPSGVEYLRSQNMHEYFAKYKPSAHFAWRHNVKLTDAPTYLWGHDLITPGAKSTSVYEKHICLSPFHKEYTNITQGIPDDKIFVTRNGVNKERFLTDIKKNENKIVFSSSPDRGLEFAIDIVRQARVKSGLPLELHVYYGFENLRKYGLSGLADILTKEIESNDWIKYHGNVDQNRLARELQEAAVWLYPANFIETYCITAIECMYAKCFPLAREIGALKDTLKPFNDSGMAKLLLKDPFTPEDRSVWADELLKIMHNKSWECINMQGYDYSWRGVAQDFMKLASIQSEDKPKERFNPMPLQRFGDFEGRL